jgi:putative Ca2+/H+ antiporter (TMEM165/GDT1 family)
MPAVFLSFLACLLLTAAGRDQVRVARLSAGLGPGMGLLVAIWLSAIAASFAAASVGSYLAPALPPAARQMFVALVLVLAAFELVVLRAPRAPTEPTRSTGAILLVLLAAQLTDSARLLVLAIALATGDPWLAAAGGTLGSGAALTLAALAGGEWEARVPLRPVTLGLAAVMLIAAVVIGLFARGLLG